VSRDYVEMAAEMAATAKCMEVLAPLPKDGRDRVILGLFVVMLGESNEGRKAVSELLARVQATVAKRPGG
jgi:hypothetical protein